MKVKILTTRYIDANEWPSVAQTFRDLSFEQSLTYGHAAAARIGGFLRFIIVQDGSTVIAATSLRVKSIPGLGRGIVWSPSGPLVLPEAGGTPDAATLHAILNALRHQICAKEGNVLRIRFPGIALHDPDITDAHATACGYRPTHKVPNYKSFAMDLHKDPQ